MGKVFSGSRQPLMGLANDNPDWQNYYTILTPFHDISRYFTIFHAQISAPPSFRSSHPLPSPGRGVPGAGTGSDHVFALGLPTTSVIWCNGIVFMNSMKR
jgi:hypothetical protein